MIKSKTSDPSVRKETLDIAVSVLSRMWTLCNTSCTLKVEKMTNSVVGGIKMANNKTFLSVQSEWSAAVCFRPNPVLLLCGPFKKTKQSLFSVYFWFSLILIFFIILSYSYLTLPEKQSSSAVAWASSGCHVFLKGCLRGTSALQIELVSITCSIRLCLLHFVYSHKLNLQSTFLTVKCIFIFTALKLPYCYVVLLAIPACSNQLRCRCSFVNELLKHSMWL